jgi:hypothetical protein
MKRVCLFVLCGVVASTMAASARTAYAIAPFKKEFDNAYVKPNPTTDAEKSLAASVAMVKCNVCHVGTSKKERNEYGKALATMLTKKDGKEIAKIKDALEKAAAMKSKPGDDSSPTFGELIQQGKLPGGGGGGDTATASN